LENKKPVKGYFLIKPEDLNWRPSNLMKIPNADFLEPALATAAPKRQHVT
jgi:hypothetical protein